MQVVKLLQREGAALVCSSCPCGSFLGKAWPVMMVKVPPTGRRWLYRRVLRLVSVWAPRRLTLEVRDSCIRECGIVQDSAGRHAPDPSPPPIPSPLVCMYCASCCLDLFHLGSCERTQVGHVQACEDNEARRHPGRRVGLCDWLELGVVL